jgi:hypothetical protein
MSLDGRNAARDRDRGLAANREHLSVSALEHPTPSRPVHIHGSGTRASAGDECQGDLGLVLRHVGDNLLQALFGVMDT